MILTGIIGNATELLENQTEGKRINQKARKRYAQPKSDGRRFCVAVGWKDNSSAYTRHMPRSVARNCFVLTPLLGNAFGRLNFWQRQISVLDQTEVAVPKDRKE
mmetsp:Transcript_781/g.2267  ORF Transcript_781/g.2267 Transcript_781/m.2267 type:complete len:104 (+) Transcript_781:141-452(+)